MAEPVVAIWKKKTKNDATYLSLSIDIDGQKYSVLCFANKKREGKNDPDFRSAKPKQEETPPPADDDLEPF